MSQAGLSTGWTGEIPNHESWASNGPDSQIITNRCLRNLHPQVRTSEPATSKYKKGTENLFLHGNIANHSSIGDKCVVHNCKVAARANLVKGTTIKNEVLEAGLGFAASPLSGAVENDSDIVNID